MSSDDDNTSQMSDLDMGVLEPTAPHLEHFKCKYDQTWDYPAIANRLFDGEKVIVQEEKVSTNHHVHFQGYTSLAPRTFGERMTELAATHYLKQKQPGSRPVKRARKGIDTTGFQYLMKEGQQPLYQRGFTQEELDELAATSKQHVHEMKFNLREFIAELDLTPVIREEPKKIYAWVLKQCAPKVFAEGSKGRSRYTRTDIQNGLGFHRQATLELQTFLLNLV